MIRLATLLICLLAALPAAARDCSGALPRGVPLRSYVLRDAVDCLISELRVLQRNQSRMAEELDRTRRALAVAQAAIPVDYLNEDGRITLPENRPIGRASFVLSARTTGGPASLALDRAVVAELCGDAGGCSLRLARRDLGLAAAPPDGTGPCLFLFDSASGGWFRSAGCGDAAARGIDGNGGAIGSGGGEILAKAGGACLLADADARRGPGPAPDQGAGPNAGPNAGPDTAFLTSDQTPGLFLIAAPERTADRAPRFRCELILE